MENKYNQKRIHPPIWQHDYHTLKRLYKQLRYLLEKYVGNRQLIVLDYGCGSSPYRELLAPFISSYTGIDLSKGESTKVIVEENGKVPLKNSSFDLILSTQVIEHVMDTNLYLSECYRLLKKQGILILSTHGIWPYHPYPDDFRRWTKAGLINELSSYGLNSLEVISILGPFASITQYTLVLIAENLIKQGVIGQLLLKFLSLVGNCIIWLEDKLFAPTRFSDAAIYVLCAKKK